MHDENNKKYAKIDSEPTEYLGENVTKGLEVEKPHAAGAESGKGQNLNEVNYNPLLTIEENPIFVGEEETGIEQPPPDEEPLRVLSGFPSDKNLKP
ncbi:hypothetical protein PspLS_07031 [Pyricularia sp. CBS 133598]|nr:hypothetical protein PspLS_07031 [Pyricularia sp. CBS 133598]